ncbi:MAG: hypothetical protein IKL97_00225, partial [Eggerthellaceae bacterium]|nr:hypothetical protein [Eggerthellaceae bacterium]
MTEENIQVEAAVEDDPIEVRRAKREALIAEGIDPYGHAFNYSHHIDQLNELMRQRADSTHIKNALRTMLREEELRGQLMGYNRPEENSVSSDEYALQPGKAVTPLLVSSIRVQP